MFQSSPAPKSRCNCVSLSRDSLPHRFQSSPAPKSRCNAQSDKYYAVTDNVSILTGSEEPVQRDKRASPITGMGFNPHRLRRAGATKVLTNAKKGGISFNPHRLRRAGATIGTPDRAGGPVVSILTGSEEPVQRGRGVILRRRWRFNPHRLRRAGATPKPSSPFQAHKRFNPHRLRRAGATLPRHPLYP